MKKPLFIFAAAALVMMASCGNKETKKDDNTDSSVEYSLGSSDSYDDSYGESTDESSTSSYDNSYSSSDDESSSSSEQSASSSVDNEDWDDILKEYEEYTNKVVALAKKAAKGDVSAISEYTEYLEDAQSLASRLQNAKGSLTAAQSSKLAKIQQKLASSLSSYKVDPSKASAAASKVKEAVDSWGFSSDDDDDD
ncbi:MAG: hypothetical protein K2N05_06695 [Muribaculaceae bacterium]|nr:hypothetical protein [Muribaculaceae bacterium]